LLQQVNGLLSRRTLMTKGSPAHLKPKEIIEAVEQARKTLEAGLNKLDHRFRMPTLELLSILWPVKART
jgi:Flp pilus assembly protein TadB